MAAQAADTVPRVYAAIAGVMAAMASEGIGKNRKNSQQNYSFRGIDDVYNALSPALAQNKLIITPRCLARNCEERETKAGGRVAYVTVEAEFDLISAEDGSKVTARTFGEAMDSADKATNKAMSAAYKYMAMQAFCIPTEGDNDADAHTHDVALSGVMLAVTAFKTAIQLCDDRSALKAWKAGHDAELAKLPDEAMDDVTRAFTGRWNSFAPAQTQPVARQRAAADEVFS